MPYNIDARIKIRDFRNGNWFWIHKMVWEDRALKSSDKVIYGTLAYFANQKTQSCFPSLHKLMDFSGLSKQTVVTCLKRLEKAGYIKKNKKKSHTGAYKTNIYTLVKNLDYVVKNNTGGSLKEYPGVVQKKATNNNYIKRINNKRGLKNLKKTMEELKLK